MKKSLALVSIVTILTGIAACVSVDHTEKKLAYEPTKGGALDVILLGDRALMVGTFLFTHKLHYASTNDDGYGIACAECHHEYKGNPGTVPQDCRDCHFKHETKTSPSI